MRDENVRVREKFELSLDGRQIASIVVGALVILGVVFVLGLNVGRQIAARQVEAARGGDLEALDRVPVATAPAKNDLTFYDQLPKGKPAPPPPEPARPAPAPAQPAAVQPAGSPPAPTATSPAPSVPAAAPAPTPPGAPAATPPPVAPSPSAPALAAVAAAPAAAAAPVKKASVAKPASAKPAATGGGFVIQLAATSSRAEAERLATRYRALSPRIETADVPGKGRFYRVRAGSFGSRAEAERALAAAARQSGAKGFVTAAR